MCGPQFEAGLKQVEVVDREGLLELSHSAARYPSRTVPGCSGRARANADARCGTNSECCAARWAAFHPPRNIRHQIATPVMKRLGAQGILAGFKDVTPKTPQPTVHQLFLQAAVARIFLRSVIEELGSKCGALLPRKTEEAQVSQPPLSDADHDTRTCALNLNVRPEQALTAVWRSGGRSGLRTPTLRPRPIASRTTHPGPLSRLVRRATLPTTSSTGLASSTPARCVRASALRSARGLCWLCSSLIPAIMLSRHSPVPLLSFPTPLVLLFCSAHPHFHATWTLIPLDLGPTRARPQLSLPPAPRLRLCARGQAIAKACVLYDDDMTRVTDLCRETVVFEQSAHLSAFLDALHAHSSPVVVERVRASHHLPGESPQSSDAAFGTGFRGVVVNLRVSARLRRL